MSSPIDSEQYKRDVARLVRDHLTDNDLTYKAAAKVAGVSQRTMHRIVHGKRDLTLREAIRLKIVRPLER